MRLTLLLFVLCNMPGGIKTPLAGSSCPQYIAHLREVKLANMPYSIWQLTEHIRITQWDILEFTTSDSHHSPTWPDQYWPSEDELASEQLWQASLSQIKKDKQAFIALLKDAEKNLFEAFA